MSKNWAEASDNQIVCYCCNVSKGEIVSAIKNGNISLKQIQSSTNACTGNQCKTLNPSGKCCSGDIAELISIYSNVSKNTETEKCCSCCCSTKK